MRAAIYASGPRIVIFSEVGACQSSLVDMYYAEERRLRRILTTIDVGLQQVRKYRDYQVDEGQGNDVAFGLLQEPTDYVRHFEWYATSLVSIAGSVRRVARCTDLIITEVIAVMRRAAV